MIWRWLAWGVAFGFVALWAAVSLGWPLGLDQGIFAWVGDTILRGGLPYVDAWEHKGPATHALYALAQWVFGRHVWSVRALDLSLLSAGAVAIGLLGRRLGGTQVGLGSALLLVLLYASGGYWHGAQPDGFASMGLLVAAALVVRRPARGGAWFAAGALCGVCALLKPFFLAWLLLLVGWAAMSFERRSAARLGGMASAGALAVFALVLLVYACHGRLADLLEVQLVYNTTLHRSAYLSLSPAEIARAIAAYLAQPWTALALALAAAWAWQKRASGRAEIALGVGWGAFALAAVVAQNQYFAYHWLPLQAPLALGAALGVRSLCGEQAGASRWRRVSAAALALAALALAAREPLAQIRLWQRSSPEEYARNFGMGTFSSATTERIAQHVAAQTQPSDRILVWGYECGIYYLADRAASTRFGFLYPLIRGGGTELEARYIEEFLRDLVESPPAYVLRFAQQLGPLPEENRRLLAIFDATLARCYELDPALQAERLEAWRRVPARPGCALLGSGASPGRGLTLPGGVAIPPPLSGRAAFVAAAPDPEHTAQWGPSARAEGHRRRWETSDMARSCQLTGKKAQFGHNVSHSNAKTNRRFLPNVQNVSLVSDALGRTLRLRISTRALRTVQKKGGLDAFLLGTDDARLPEEALRLKRKVRKRLAQPKRATS